MVDIETRAYCGSHHFMRNLSSYRCVTLRSALALGAALLGATPASAATWEFTRVVGPEDAPGDLPFIDIKLGGYDGTNLTWFGSTEESAHVAFRMAGGVTQVVGSVADGSMYGDGATSVAGSVFVRTNVGVASLVLVRPDGAASTIDLGGLLASDAAIDAQGNIAVSAYDLEGHGSVLLLRPDGLGGHTLETVASDATSLAGGGSLAGLAVTQVQVDDGTVLFSARTDETPSMTIYRRADASGGIEVLLTRADIEPLPGGLNENLIGRFSYDDGVLLAAGSARRSAGGGSTVSASNLYLLEADGGLAIRQGENFPSLAGDAFISLGHSSRMPRFGATEVAEGFLHTEEVLSFADALPFYLGTTSDNPYFTGTSFAIVLWEDGGEDLFTGAPLHDRPSIYIATLVPEPGAVALAGIAGVAALARRSRRRGD